MKAGRLDEALVDMNRVIDLRPEGAEGYIWRGAALWGQSQRSAAEADWRHARELDPKQFRRRMKSMSLGKTIRKLVSEPPK